MKSKYLMMMYVLMLVGGGVSGQPGAVSGRQATVGGRLSTFKVEVKDMDAAKKERLSRTVSRVRSTRGVLSAAMISAGATAALHVAAEEVLTLTKIRSTQRRAWHEMREGECEYRDSVESMGGQTDFYGGSSVVGPMDPSNIRFDGMNVTIERGGYEVMKLVCRLDSSRFEDLYLHGRFYLELDTFVFYPYRSFVPNIGVDVGDLELREDMSEEVVRYWMKNGRFSFGEQQGLTIGISIDIVSSWINELSQVYEDVKLGTFKLNVPIKESDLHDSVFAYYRSDLTPGEEPKVAIEGSSFVVPRSYMSVGNRPSWGTGEFKMKVRFTERCQYNPMGERAQNWKRDYKRMKQLRGGYDNEYIKHIITTFRESGRGIIKATYTPALNSLASPEAVTGQRQHKSR